MYMSHELIYHICTWVTNSLVICQWCPFRNSKGPLLYMYMSHELKCKSRTMDMSHKSAVVCQLCSFGSSKGAPAICTWVTNWHASLQLCICVARLLEFANNFLFGIRKCPCYMYMRHELIYESRTMYISRKTAAICWWHPCRNSKGPSRIHVHMSHELIQYMSE